MGQIVQQETSTGKLLLDVVLIEPDVLPMEMTSPAEVGRKLRQADARSAEPALAGVGPPDKRRLGFG